MKIRFATKEDVDTVLALGREMHAESRFAHYPLNDEKAVSTIHGMIANPHKACLLLAQRADGKIAGMLAAYMSEFFFCDAIAVQDRWFYVLPQYRGSSAAVKLIIALRQWAESKKVNELCINMSVAVEMERFNKLMTHMGFKCCGSNFSIVLT